MNTITTTTAGAALVLAPEPTTTNPAAIYIAALTSPASRRTMRQALYAVACIITDQAPGAASEADQTALVMSLPWAELRSHHAAAIRSTLAERYAPAGANKVLSALRGTLKAAITQTRQAARAAALADGANADMITRLARARQDDLEDAIEALKVVRGGSEELRGRALARGEVRAIFAACSKDDSPAGYRDAALFGLLYACGMRRAELAAADLADLVITGEDDATLTVMHGKGNKRRVIPINDGALDAVKDWLSVRGDEPGPLFVSVNKGGRLVFGENMTSQAIYNILAKRGREANVKNFSPHDLRRTFISDLLDAGADIATVQKLAGHANVTTTARYDRRGERAKRKAVGLLHIPYERRRLD